jgi:hypothetical protein
MRRSPNATLVTAMTGLLHWHAIFLMVVLAISVLGGCETSSAGSTPSAAPPPPASRKWVAPWMPGPAGIQLQRTFYYGPWQCSRKLMDACQTKCVSQSYRLMGCIWIADIKVDTRGSLGPVDYAAGGRLAMTHCCCDYPRVQDTAARRSAWDNARDKFRKEWSEDFGGWPLDDEGIHWPGHHMRDLGHGGNPTAKSNVLPTPQETHAVLHNKLYPQCYAGAAPWNTIGPDLPYAD